MSAYEKHLVLAGLALCVFVILCPLPAGSEGPEDYRIELSATLWRMNSNGTINADGSPINLLTDLGVGQRQRIYDGRSTFKFKRKLRFVLEGTPLSIQGLTL